MTIKDRTMVSSVTFGAELPQRHPVPSDDSAFRILVIGNLGAATSFHTPVFIDRDELDQVIDRLKIRFRLQLKDGDPALEIRVREFEDFHPDRLFGQLGVFEALRSRRKRLQDDATCREEIAAIMKANAADADGPEPAKGVFRSSGTSSSNDSELLSRAVGVTQALQKPLEEQVLEGVVDWDAYVRQLVAPYVVSKADPRQAELIAGVDVAITDTMRAILHNSSYQQIEAAWQGIRFLTRRLETDRTLQLSVMHVALGDLTADVLDGDDLTQTKLYKILVDDVAVDGSDPWSLVVGDFLFGISSKDCDTLARIAKICEAAGVIFTSGAAPEIAGGPGFAHHAASDEAADPPQLTSPGEEVRQLWNQIRNLTASQHVVLALPKLMARRPYGPESDPVESFPFHEIPDGTRREHYLWMNAAFGIAALLGQAFASAGWNLAQAIPSELERLPHYLFSSGGEEQIQPGTETALSERTAEVFAQSGLTIFRSVRNEDTVRVATLRTLSVSHPGLPGKGRE